MWRLGDFGGARREIAPEVGLAHHIDVHVVLDHTPLVIQRRIYGVYIDYVR